MGRSKKPRKSYNPKKGNDAIFNRVKRTLWCADGHCLEALQLGGAPVASKAGLANKIKTAQLVSQFSDRLTKDPQSWQVMIIGFAIDPDAGPYYDTLQAELPDYPITSAEVKAITDPQINDFIQTITESEYVSSGWFATPCGDADITGMLELEIIPFFEKAGAWNRDIVDLNIATRADLAKQKELNNAA